jgi:hypothetical protein
METRNLNWDCRKGEIYRETDGRTIFRATYYDEDDEQQSADVSLAAAAPDLLEALRGLVNCHTRAVWQTTKARRRWWLAATRAIAKAAGRL